MELNKEQKQAVQFAIDKKLSLLIGPGGYGKTFTIKEIANNLDCPALCSFTGKAANRIREESGISASTIHRLLGFNGSHFTVKSLSGMDVIMDEASMTSSMLMAEVIKRNPNKLILIGDSSQLFPVDGGCPFIDTIKIRPDLVTELKHCYRASAAVHRACNEIRNGIIPGNYESEDETFEFISSNKPDEYILNILDQIDFNNDTIICPKNGKLNHDTGKYQDNTVNGLNNKIVDIINPRPNGWEHDFMVGDRVICKKNFYEKEIWNGSVGTVTGIDSLKSMWVRDDLLDEEILFNKEMINSCQLAYAITIHSSQGSQYNKVFVVCLDKDHIMLTRSLIYTAATRAKSQCFVIGNKSAMVRAIGNVCDRNTVLKELHKNGGKK